MGTSILLCVVLYRGTDHPHAYGDKYRFKVARTLDNGSSPRVWGQGEMIFQRIQQLRIIPTRMGTSSYLRRLPAECRDHPHAYGDKFHGNTLVTKPLGSSPRVWGQVIGDLDTSAILGIIPTRMGTRLKNPDTGSPAKDHPHAYGDKLVYDDSLSYNEGSSPRVWGQEPNV